MIILIRKSELILQIPPEENSNYMSTGMVNSVGSAEVGNIGRGRTVALVVSTAWCPLVEWNLGYK